MPQYIQKAGGEKTTLEKAGFSTLQEASDKGGFQPVSAPKKKKVSRSKSKRTKKEAKQKLKKDLEDSSKNEIVTYDDPVDPNVFREGTEEDLRQANEPVQATELEDEQTTQRDLEQTQEEVKNKEKSKQRVLDTYQNLQNKDVRANEAFIQAAAQAARGRPATQDELKSQAESRFGLRGLSARDVMDRFGLLQETQDMGMEDEGVQGTQDTQKDTQGTQKDTEGTQGRPTTVEEGLEKRQSIMDQMDDLVSGIGEARQTEKQEAREEYGVPEKQEAFTQAQKKVNDFKTQLDNLGIRHMQEEQEVENEPIPLSNIRDQIQAMSDDQKMETMIVQNKYNNALAQQKLAQGKVQQAQQMVQDTVSNWAETQQMKLDQLQTKYGYTQDQIDRLENEVEFERGLREKGYVKIDDPEQLSQLAKEYNVTASNYSQFFYDDPASDDVYLKPQTEEEEEQWEFEVLEDEEGNERVVKTNPNTGEVRDTTESGNATLMGFDISDYASDPKHEQKVAKIVKQDIGKFASQAELSSYIQKNYPDSPITSDMVVNASREYGVPWELLVGMMEQDSSLGTKGKGARTKNPGNVGTYGDKVGEYSSWQAGVDAVARWLDRHRAKGEDKEEAPEPEKLPEMDDEKVTNYMRQALASMAGDDGYVSPSDWKNMRRKWVQVARRSPGEFEEEFKDFTNPNNPNYIMREKQESQNETQEGPY